MADEGATGLSTAAIEAVLDSLGDDEPTEGREAEDAARAELAALLAAAERATALAAALAVYADRDNWAEGEGDFPRFILEDEYHAGGPRPWDTADTALAGRGAAGARDEAALLAAALRVARWVVLAPHEVLGGEWAQLRGVATDDPAVVEAVKAFRALDAPRAGGAGDKEG